MRDKNTTRLLLLMAFSLLSCVPLNAADTEDYTIRPGTGIGSLRLGMTEAQIGDTLGKPDGKYSLPSGQHAEYSQWKDPGSVSTVRIFFDSTGKTIQLSCEETGTNKNDKLATKDGIRVGATLAEVTSKYGPFKCLSFRAKDGRIDYYDDTARGIAFKYTWAETDGEAKKRLYAIIVHRPGRSVLADADERPITQR